MEPSIEKTILIPASPTVVWHNLTNPKLMKRWMAEPGMDLEINTSWQPGSPFRISGSFHGRFENKGTVLQVKRNQLLIYTHASSVSELPDAPASYTVFEFRLAAVQQHTLLTLHIKNFPTETIFRHLDLYWGSTLRILKEFIEQNSDHISI